MNFGDAIAALKAGHRVAREGWDGKGMYLFLVPGSVFKVNREPLLSMLGEGTEVQYHAHIDMKTAQGYVVPWFASQPDMLSEDWAIVGPVVNAAEPQAAQPPTASRPANCRNRMADEGKIYPRTCPICGKFHKCPYGARGETDGA